EVEVADEDLILGLRGLPNDAAAWIAEVARAVELRVVERLLDADPVDGADPVAVGDGVGRLLELPEIPRQRFDRGRRVEDDLCPFEPKGAGGLGKVPVVAEQRADAADRGAPHRGD